MKILLPLLIVLAVVYAGYQVFLSQQPVAPEPMAISPDMLQDSIANPSPASFDVDLLQTQVTELLDGLPQEIENVKDERATGELVTLLTDMNEQFDNLHPAKWPESAKTALIPYLSSFVEKFEAALPSAYQVPQARSLIEPLADRLIGKVKALLPADE